MLIIFSASITNKLNNIKSERFNVYTENTFEIKTEKDFRNTNEQNSVLIIEDDCRVKLKTDDIPDNLSLLSSLEEKCTLFQNNDDNNQYHTKG